MSAPIEIGVLELWPTGYADCWNCGEPSYKKGIPIANGEPVSNDYVGEWAGVPACDECFALQEAGKLAELRQRRKGLTA